MQQPDDGNQSTQAPGSPPPTDLATTPEPRLEARVARLERDQTERTTFAAYSRIYAPLAVMTGLMHALPIYADVLIADDTRRTFGTVWQMASQGASPAALGILLMATLTACLGVATVRVRTPALPGAMAGMSLLLLIMVLTKPGTGEPAPDLAEGGLVAVTLGLAMTVLGVVHATHLVRHQQRGRQGPPMPTA